MIKTGEHQTEGKENDSIQESKTKATTHVATASVVNQLCILANTKFKTFSSFDDLNLISNILSVVMTPNAKQN
jgi:hypothetical protein